MERERPDRGQDAVRLDDVKTLNSTDFRKVHVNVRAMQEPMRTVVQGVRQRSMPVSPTMR